MINKGIFLIYFYSLIIQIIIKIKRFWWHRNDEKDVMCSEVCFALGGTVVSGGYGTRKDCCKPGRAQKGGVFCIANALKTDENDNWTDSILFKPCTAPPWALQYN